MKKIITDESERAKITGQLYERTGYTTETVDTFESQSTEQEATGSNQGDESGDGRDKRTEKKPLDPKVSAQITAKEKELQAAINAKNKKFAELNGRNTIFGDSEKQDNALFDEMFEPTNENMTAALAPFQKRIDNLKRELQNLNSNAEEASSQLTFDEIIDKAAHDDAISKAEAQVSPNPTEAQKEAGNYKKGHVNINGFDITIETVKGTKRTGKDEDGNEWKVTMNNSYGYYKSTNGTEGKRKPISELSKFNEDNNFVKNNINEVSESTA